MIHSSGAYPHGDRPTPITSSTPGSFAWGVFHDRNPAIIGQVAAATPYPPHIRRALDDLTANLAEGPMGPLPHDAPDKPRWDTYGRAFNALSWFDAPFLYAESYFYRRLLDAVDYFRPGPWRGVDPFEPQKSAELTDPEFAAELTGLLALETLSPAEQLTAALDAALWGNRADLGFRLSGPASQHLKHAEDLVADHSEHVHALLNATPGGTVCIVADNAGRELIPDLVLIDVLLRHRIADTAELHLKPHPYYVSDATSHDLIACIRRLAAVAATLALAARLTEYIRRGALAVVSNEFYCSPLTYHDLPRELAASFADAKLTILKGDLNYRRLVGDLHWPAITRFDDVVSYFPGPVAAVRTLKSDVVVGLTHDTLVALDATAERWRVIGIYGLIQVRP